MEIADTEKRVSKRAGPTPEAGIFNTSLGVTISFEPTLADVDILFVEVVEVLVSNGWVAQDDPEYFLAHRGGDQVLVSIIERDPPRVVISLAEQLGVDS